MENTTKWEVTTKYTRAQIFTHNAKCTSFIQKRDTKIEKMDKQIQKINEEIQKMKKQISEIQCLKSVIEYNIWDHEIQIEARNASYMTTEAHKQQKEFFEDVVMFALLNRWNPDFQTMRAYKLTDGKWYSQTIRIPCDSNGDMDESKTFFQKVEEEI